MFKEIEIHMIIVMIVVFTVIFMVVAKSDKKHEDNNTQEYTIEFLGCDNQVTSTVTTSKLRRFYDRPVIVYYDPETKETYRYHGNWRIKGMEDKI